MPLLQPLSAYHRDRLRAGTDVPFGPSDEAWLVIATFLDNLGVLDGEARDLALVRHERALAEEFGAEPAPLPDSHPWVWASRLRMALTTNPLAASHPEVTLVVRGMADAMADVGAVELGEVTLHAVRRAFPKVCPRTSVGVLMHRASLLARIGHRDEAMELAAVAYEEASTAKLLDLMHDVQRERSEIADLAERNTSRSSMHTTADGAGAGRHGAR